MNSQYVGSLAGTKSYKIKQVGLRMVKEKTISLPIDRCSDPAQAALIGHKLIGHMPIEYMIAILINSGGDITNITTLSQGGAHSASLKVPDILRAVLIGHADAFVLIHNHPNNDPTPSRQDLETTAAIGIAANLVGLPMLDHLVVTAEKMKFRSCLG